MSVGATGLVGFLVSVGCWVDVGAEVVFTELVTVGFEVFVS